MNTTHGNEMNERNDPDLTRVLVVAVARAIRRWTARSDEKADLVQECRERIREFDEKRGKGRRRTQSPTNEEVARLKEQLAAMQEALTKLSESRADDRITEFIAAHATTKETHESRMDAMCRSQERMESSIAELAKTVATLVTANLAPQAPARPSSRRRPRHRPRPRKHGPETDEQTPPHAAVGPAKETEITSEAVASSMTIVTLASANEPELAAANPAADLADPSRSLPALEVTADLAHEPEFVGVPDAIDADRDDADELDDEAWGSTASLTRAAEVHELAPDAVVEEAWEEIHTALAASARGDHRAATKHWQRADELTERTSLESPDPEGRRSLGQLRLRRALSMARVGDPRAMKVSSSATLLALEVARMNTTPELLTELGATATEHTEIAKRFGRDVSEDDVIVEAFAFMEVARPATSDADEFLALKEATS